MSRISRRVLGMAMAIVAIVFGNHFPVARPGGFGPSPAAAAVVDHPIEGFGALTTGGAGRPDCIVTSLADSGSGTLRACLSSGNRYVKFAVAGTIRLTSLLRVGGPNVTIDGFTAPSPGITLSDWGLAIWHSVGTGDASNVIVRGIRIRNAQGNPGDTDCISIYGPTSNIVIDHVSTEGCGDGSIDISSGPKDITIQWSVISTGYGTFMLIGSTSDSPNRDTDRISLHHNMLICRDTSGCDRAPLIRANGFPVRVDLRNNVIQGWLRANGTKIEANAWVNVVGNAYIPRSDSTLSQREASVAVGSGTRVYTSGNLELGSSPRPNLNDNGNQSSPMPAPDIIATPLGCVVRDAGMQPRDSVDQRLLTFVTAVPADCAAPPPPPPPPTQQPDLVSRSLGAPSTAAAGQSLSLSATIANVGTGAASGSIARLYLSTDRTVTTGDVVLGSITVPALAPGASHTATANVTLPATTTAGAYMLLVRADDGAAVAESSESNNILAIPITVAAASGPFVPRLIEGETMAVTSGMTVGTDAAALGGRYVSPTSGANSTAPVREASAGVAIPATGTYYLWARMYAPSTAADALYIGIDSSWQRVFPGTVGTYQWVAIGSGFQLTPGTHTIQIGRGEINARLDAVYLTNSATDVPKFAPGSASFTPLLVQAETMAVASGMTVGTDAGALGGRYVSPTSGANSTAPVREASASVSIPTAGTYYLWARMYAPSTAADALYIGIDSSWQRVFPGTVGTYQWVAIGSGFQLAPGTHTIQLGRGELNARVDAVYLTNSATEVPTFTP